MSDTMELPPDKSIGEGRYSVGTGIGVKGEIAGQYSFSLEGGVPQFTLQNDNWDDVVTIWSADVSPGQALPNQLLMQRDGNLCLYDKNDKFLWGTMTQDIPGAPGSSLIINGQGWAGLSHPDRPGVIWSFPGTWQGGLRFVPPPKEDPAPPQGPAFLESLEVNKYLKAAVVGAIGIVPEVGGILSKITNALWPENHPQTLQWEQIREGMKTIAQDLINKDKALKLHEDVQKLVGFLQKYNSLKPGDEKWSEFSNIGFWFDQHKKDFMDNTTPWDTVQDFVQEGTLHLAFLRHQWQDGSQIFPRDKDVNNAVHKKELEDTCEKYVATAKKIRGKCLEWRIGQITSTGWEDDGMRGFYGQDKKCYVKDEFRSPPVVHEIKSSAQGDFSQVTGNTLVAKYRENLKDSADIVYRQQLDDILTPTLLWPLFKEETRPVPGKLGMKREVCWSTDIMGYGFSERMHHFNDRDFAELHGPITRIELYGHDRVDGFQVWYGGVTSGMRGARELSGHFVALDIDVSKESIVEFSGRVGQYLQSLKVFVSSDKMIQAGDKLGFGGDDNYRESFHMGNREIGPDREGQGMGTLKYVYGWYKDGNAGVIEQLGAVFSRMVAVEETW